MAPDPIIHPLTRLSMCALLASVDESEFATVRDAVGVSDSQLSKHARALEEAGYVRIRKGAVGRRPRTWFKLTVKGRKAFEAHMAYLGALVGTTGA